MNLFTNTTYTLTKTCDKPFFSEQFDKVGFFNQLYQKNFNYFSCNLYKKTYWLTKRFMIPEWPI